MPKDPAFLFYYQDWLVGTYFLNREQKGAYIDLLCYQADKDILTLKIIKDILNSDYEDCWPKIKDKFIEENGEFYNKRLREEKNKRIQYSESRRLNRTNISRTYDAHMENENEDENEDENKDTNIKKRSKKFIAPALSEVVTYFKEKGYTEQAANKAYEYYNVADWHDAQGKKVKNWKQKMNAVWFKEENKRITIGIKA